MVFRVCGERHYDSSLIGNFSSTFSMGCIYWLPLTQETYWPPPCWKAFIFRLFFDGISIKGISIPPLVEYAFNFGIGFFFVVVNKEPITVPQTFTEFVLFDMLRLARVPSLNPANETRSVLLESVLSGEEPRARLREVT